MALLRPMARNIDHTLAYPVMWILLIIVPMGVTPPASSQDKDTLSASAFIDTTIAHDFNRLPSRDRPYTTQPYYNNEGALNLGFVDARLSTDRYHGRIAMQYGSSVVANYADEADEFVRYFQEAYGGVQISDTWHVDAGVYFSHIGMESWISRDDYTVGRSIIADYSPYYQSGVRSVHQLSDRLHVELQLLRGWQNISNDRDPSLGTQVAYDLTPQTKVVYNTFIGNEDGLRVYNDFVMRHAFSRRFGVAAAFDLGLQNRSEESFAWWYGWSIIPHYSINKTVAIAGRVEQFSDPHQVVLESLSNESFNATSLSANIDITLLTDLVWRSEYRAYVSSRDLFPDNGGYSTTDNVMTTSIIYSLR
jgi:hypothetical protein